MELLNTIAVSGPVQIKHQETRIFFSEIPSRTHLKISPGILTEIFQRLLQEYLLIFLMGFHQKFLEDNVCNNTYSNFSKISPGISPGRNFDRYQTDFDEVLWIHSVVPQGNLLAVPPGTPTIIILGIPAGKFLQRFFSRFRKDFSWNAFNDSFKVSSS